MDPTLGRWAATALVVSMLTIGAFGVGVGSSRALPGATSTSPVTGNISGPHVVATNSTSVYHINGTGGPAYVGGHLTGTISWRASVSGTNKTGLSVSPNSSTLVSGKAGRMNLTVPAIVQTVTLTVELISSNDTTNETTNLTYLIGVVVPYVVRATLISGPEKVLAFTVAVALDGQTVGNVSVPSIDPNSSYTLQYSYATNGLSAGTHTFTISLVGEHGLVVFAGGALEYSQTFYVKGSPPNYGLWVAVGVALFIGALFIFAIRVSARRRPTSRR